MPEFHLPLTSSSSTFFRFVPAEDSAAKAKADGKRAPRGRVNPVQDQHNPTVMFNGMIAPVVGYAIRDNLTLWTSDNTDGDDKEGEADEAD